MSIGLRRYLYFTAACTGACILVVEILGAKCCRLFLVRPILFGRRKLR